MVEVRWGGGGGGRGVDPYQQGVREWDSGTWLRRGEVDLCQQGVRE